VAVVHAVEAPEDPDQVLRRHPRPLVGDLDQRVPAGGAHTHGGRGARRGVVQHVRQQVAHHLAQPRGVADHPDRAVVVQRQRPVRVDRQRVGHRVGGQLGQLDRPALQRPALVEAGEQEQLLHQRAHPGRLRLDPAHRLLQVVLAGRRPAPEQPGVTAGGRHRGAQLVRGRRDEPAQPVLRLRTLAEGPLDLAQHGVERVAEPADLRALRPRLDPPAQVAAADRGRRVHDAVQRAQAAPDQQRRQQGQRRQPEPGRADQHERHPLGQLVGGGHQLLGRRQRQQPRAAGPAPVLDGAERRPRRQGQRERQQADDGPHQTGSQRHHASLGRRSTYPTRGTVWMSGGSNRSTLRRR